MSTRGTTLCNARLRKRKRASGLSIPMRPFVSWRGKTRLGLYLDAYTDAEHAFAVLDLVSDWLVDLSVNAGVHLHVIPLPKEAAGAHA